MQIVNMLVRTLIAASMLLGVCTVAANSDSPAGTAGYQNYVGDSQRDLSRLLGGSDFIPMDTLVRDLMLAIDQMTKYRIPSERPVVVKKPQDEVAKLACGRPCDAQAFYRASEGIVLSHSLDPERNVFARSILLHELVHFVQDHNGELRNAIACDRYHRREREAYAVQKRFLEMVGSLKRVGYASSETCDSDTQG